MTQGILNSRNAFLSKVLFYGKMETRLLIHVVTSVTAEVEGHNPLVTVYDFWLHVPPRGILLDLLNIHRLILFPLLCLSLSCNSGRPNCLSEEGIWFIKDLLGIQLQPTLLRNGTVDLYYQVLPGRNCFVYSL